MAAIANDAGFAHEQPCKNACVFANASLARRIERAEVTLIVEGARAAARRLAPDQPVIAEVCGGAVVFTEVGSPFNKGVGFGFGGVPPSQIFDALEGEFRRRGAPLQFEISNLADPAFARTLTQRGYALVGFENVLGLAITPAVVQRFSMLTTDVDVAPARPEESAAWLDTVATGFLHPDVFDGPGSHETISRESLERVFQDVTACSGFEQYLARRQGTIAGGASFRIHEGVAQLAGAATLPDHRRRGVQSALLAHRLCEAGRRGCDIAVVTTQPGSKSQENVQRAGFEVLYTRAVLVREPA